MEKLPFEKIKRRVLVRKKVKTDSKYGCKPKERSVKDLINYGIINLNKSSGPTSHQQVAYVKNIFGLKKAGHSGTLDPKVIGVLPIALGRATRIVQTLLKAGKEYVGLMHLHKEISKNKIVRVSKEFIGKVKQLPPVKSAIRRKLREREIYYLKILEIDGKDVLFRIGCEAGFYIRKFCVQFGEKLDCGAHLVGLIRTKAGPFTDKDWVSLQDLKDAYEFYKDGSEEEIKKVIQPIERAVEHLPKIWVFDTAVDALCHGADLYVIGVAKLNSYVEKNDLIAIFTLKDELICLGNAEMSSKEMLKKEKGLAVRTSKVFMEPGVYSD